MFPGFRWTRTLAGILKRKQICKTYAKPRRLNFNYRFLANVNEFCEPRRLQVHIGAYRRGGKALDCKGGTAF